MDDYEAAFNNIRSAVAAEVLANAIKPWDKGFRIDVEDGTGDARKAPKVNITVYDPVVTAYLRRNEGSTGSGAGAIGAAQVPSPS